MNLNAKLLLFIMLIILMIFFLIPGNIEKFMKESENNGNIAINGVCLDIYYKRNLFYFSLFLLISSIIYKIIYLISFSIFITIITCYIYYNTCNKWKFFFKLK